MRTHLLPVEFEIWVGIIVDLKNSLLIVLIGSPAL